MKQIKMYKVTGWHFNKEDHVLRSPDANGNYLIPSDYLRFDVHDGLYDRTRDVVKKMESYTTTLNKLMFSQATYILT